MPAPTVWTPALEQRAIALRAQGLSIRDICSDLGISFGAVQKKLIDAGTKRKGFTTESIPSPNRPVDELFRDQADRFRRKKARWDIKHEGIRITLEDPGPYAILFCGDPHADDDGCDLERLASDVLTAQEEPHVYAACMGDFTNNWIRALGHLYAHQGTTDDEAEALADWLLGAIDWMFVILGNHDKWSPLAARICKDNGVTYVSHGGMFKVISGGRECVIDARHTHKGNSQFNPSHAQLKRNHRGSKADIIIGAHIHTSAYTMLKNGLTGKIGHAIRVGAYKRFDEYADANNFEDETISPSVLCVVDPSASPEGFVTVFHDIDRGVRFLRALRSEAVAA